MQRMALLSAMNDQRLTFTGRKMGQIHIPKMALVE